MWFPQSFPLAFTLLIVGMVLWGSWINAYRFAQNWRLELFHIDYSVGILVVAVLGTAGAGMCFGSPNALENFLAADRSAWLWAAAAGALVNAGNLALMAAISQVGLTVAFPVSVGISLILGTFLSYWVMPRGDPRLLALSVTLILAGVLTNSYAHHCRARHALTRNRSRSGLGICIASGLLFTCGAPMVAKALASRTPLEPYGVCILFALGSLMAAVPLLWCLARYPVEGERIAYRGYFQGSIRNHAAGLLGGALWGGGMLLTFVPAAMVGMAISSAVGQADPLVASLWGIFVWHEFQGAPVRAQIALAVMFALFIAGLVTIGFCYRGAKIGI